jgi:hypothetical protein
LAWVAILVDFLLLGLIERTYIGKFAFDKLASDSRATKLGYGDVRRNADGEVHSKYTGWFSGKEGVYPSRIIVEGEYRSVAFYRTILDSHGGLERSNKKRQRMMP